MRIETTVATEWHKCSCCSEQIRTGERVIRLMNGKRPVKGETYCEDCQCYAYENNIDAIDADEAERNAEREREEWAAYLAAGATQEYFNDREAGY